MSCASPFEVVARFENSLAHVWADGELVVSRRNEIFAIRDLSAPRMVKVAAIPWTPLQRLARFRCIDRAVKHSILQVHKTPRGFLVSTGHAWWYLEGSRIEPVLPAPATRPMNRGICDSPSSRVYIADYRLNPHRDPVRIFRLDDALRFETAWEFPAGAVRHVHALIRDSGVASRIWILTGDRDPECGIWYTDDEFASMHSFLAVGQESRATDLIVHDGHLFWGMDTPDETPSVVRASCAAPGRRVRLFDLPGPAYYLSRNEAGGFYVGTTVEPGRAMRDGRAHLLRFAPDGRFEDLLSCAKDWVPQHGIFSFPKGLLPGAFLVFAQRALRPHEGCLTIARDRIWG